MTTRHSVAGRVSAITPFIVMDILDRVRQMEAAGEDIVHMEVGEPDFDPPAAVRRSALAALDRGDTGYAPSLGLTELRREIAASYKRNYGIDVPMERVVVTSGSSPALQMIFALLVEKGDEVVMPVPHYACYANYVTFFGGTPVYVETSEEDGFRLSPGVVEKRLSKKTKAILVNSPANPTGAVMSGEDLRAIAALGVPVISDEIYHGLVFDGEAHSILEYSDDAFVVDGFSKRYAMTGWRIGYCVLPERYVRPFQLLLQSFYISAPTLSQYGALAALREGEAEAAAMRDAFKERRDYLIGGLARIGLPVTATPGGAFYIYVNVGRFTKDSLSFANALLEGGKVAVTPGVDFGPGGEEYIRLSYAISIERLEEGLRRIESCLKGLKS